MRRKKQLVLVAGLLVALSVMFSSANAAEVYYDYKTSSWHANSVMSDVEYIGAAHTLSNSTAEFFAMGTTGVDYVEWTSGTGWHVQGQATSDTVLSFASATGISNPNAYYVRSDGVLAQTFRFSSGTWSTAVLGGATSGISYSLVATHYDAATKLFAARAGGGLDYIRYTGGNWQISSQLNTDKVYTSIAGNYDGSYDVLGSLAGGGLYWDEYGTTEATISTDLYSQVVTNRKARSFFALKADGTVQWVDDNDGDITFSIVNLNANSYSLIEAGLAADSVYAARTDGGLDYIYYDDSSSSWVTEQADADSNNVYIGIARSAAATNKDVFAIVIPEPATMGLLAVGGLGIVLRRKR